MSITPTPRLLIVSIEDQQIALLSEAQVEARFPISTSKKPPSCRENSYGTPTGLHRLADKIGADAPSGMVFKGRQAIKHFTEFNADEQAQNLITSRIIRIQGLEPGKNAGPGCDSYERYVYLHGTNHEDRIGQPFSGGCVEFLNQDIIQLFDQVETGDLLWIV
ncbi:ErfK/YbiS/YcfS/YnhG family protein [Coraliomargarita akajimensis DSM 45221]|uniref:ErfK/YbiS/YcfS/YnhG family protein n=1 Tax=Coraliomargarita akajimensis (strain DSM 45221 / IAM 15411 / JCM 23193 / KCTC 12865 / 04OKA010-24) TaxID=583355 RepID=D5EQD5_CORAD|nr:ErfK/YbiS/YcfS/YnhG family protein [Coraliomargarita akajimensis DSM 45221]